MPRPISHLFPLDGQHGDIVKLGGIPHKAGQILADRPQKFLRVRPRHRVQRGHHAVRPVQGIVPVRGLRHAVGVHKEGIAGVQGQLILPVPGPLHPGQDKAVLVLHQGEAAVPPIQRRVLMPRVGGGEAPGGDLIDAQPDSHKHLRVIVLAQLIVHLLQDLPGGLAHLGRILQQSLGDNHKQRRRHALAGHVGDDHGQMVLVHQEEIVEVAPHLLGRGHGRIDVELMPVRERREDAGQHMGLDFCRHIQLRADALLFRRDVGQIPDILPQLHRHVLEGLGELLQLVAGVDVHTEILQILHLPPNQLPRGPVQDPQRADQDAADIEIIGHDGHDQHGEGDEQSDPHQLPDLAVDHIHGNVHAGQGGGLSAAVQDGHIGRGQVAVLLIVRDQDDLGGVRGKGGVHELVPAAVVGIRVPQIADSVLPRDPRVPDIEHHVVLRHDHIKIPQPHLLPDGLEILLNFLVVGVLLPGAVVPLNAVPVNQAGGDGRLVEGHLRVVLLHLVTVYL